MIETIGWIGSLCFALSAIPQAWHSYRAGNSNGVSWGLLSLWLMGELCMIVYILPKVDAPLLFNYFGNLIFLFVIIRYKAFPRSPNGI